MFGELLLFNAAEVAQALTAASELFIGSRPRIVCEKLIEQREMMVREAQAFLRLFAEREQVTVLLDPFGRDFADAAVGQLDEAFTLAHGAAHFGQRDLYVAELHDRLHVEPVNPRSDAERDRRAAAVDARQLQLFLAVNLAARGGQLRDVAQQKIERVRVGAQQEETGSGAAQGVVVHGGALEAVGLRAERFPQLLFVFGLACDAYERARLRVAANAL